MKQVLLIDGSPVYNEFLTEKLAKETIKVISAQGERDAFIKLLSVLPNLVIIDVENSVSELTDFLFKKQSDPNAKSIPIILIGPKIEKEKLAELLRYGVVKYFTAPIKFDVFFETIGNILKEPIYLDPTPCILDVHLNNNIIFVEIARGLNYEKLALLRYKISELVDANNLLNPKIVVMLTNLELTFVDATNLESLFDSIVANKSIERKNIKILSLDPIVKELIAGHPQYKGLEVVTNLSKVLGSLVDSSSAENTSDLITDKILAADKNVLQGSVEMRFSADTGSTAEGENGNVINVAVVDGDLNTRNLLKDALSSVGANTSLFANSADFLASLAKTKYDLIILDLFVRGISGLAVLQFLKKTKVTIPVVIYSQPVQQNVLIQVIQLGAKTFIPKPQTPEVIAKKVIDVLNGKS